jgi:hypothetical protein
MASGGCSRAVSAKGMDEGTSGKRGEYSVRRESFSLEIVSGLGAFGRG